MNDFDVIRSTLMRTLSFTGELGYTHDMYDEAMAALQRIQAALDAALAREAALREAVEASSAYLNAPDDHPDLHRFFHEWTRATEAALAEPEA